MVQPLGPRWAPGSFLARLPAAQATHLLGQGVRRQFEPGQRLMREGERSNHVELLYRGFVKITNVVDGIEVLMGIRMPGDFVGELAGLTGRPRIATASACGRVTSYVISKRDFHSFLHEYPDAPLNMAAVMGERLRWANERRTDFAAFPADVRLARVLVEIALACGRETKEGLSIEVMLSQPELATMIGVSDATIQKVFRDLRRSGWIRTGYRRIMVLDLPALRSLGTGTDNWQTMTG
jgi:cAMP-binding proteins - catabolite gene activator and regulatory subunit of cAMP-dependent protein kinases